MASPLPDKAIRLALSLPPLLTNFFRRHPPGTFALTTPPTSSTSTSTIRQSTSPTTLPPPPETLTALSASRNAANPFLPWKNPSTGAWRAPLYSARRQSQLYDAAQAHGVLSLLPQAGTRGGPPTLRAAKRADQGLRVRGTGVGQKVKGRKWERKLRPKLEAREKAMEGMSQLIKEWKQRGHGRGWKKWPK